MQKARRHPVSGALSFPLSGCFSSFSRLTGSLSVVKECLALESGLPIFKPGSTSPILLEGIRDRELQGFHLLWRAFQPLHLTSSLHPRSLAATNGVALLSFPGGT